MKKLNTSESVYYSLATKDLKQCDEVLRYYRDCLRKARASHIDYASFKRMLAIVGELKREMKRQPKLSIN